MNNPFEIKNSTCISFSGGRTSAFMLYKVLEAHQMSLPSNCVVCFANTGKKMRQLLGLFKTVLRNGMLKFIGLNGAITI